MCNTRKEVKQDVTEQTAEAYTVAKQSVAAAGLTTIEAQEKQSLILQTQHRVEDKKQRAAYADKNLHACGQTCFNEKEETGFLLEPLLLDFW